MFLQSTSIVQDRAFKDEWLSDTDRMVLKSLGRDVWAKRRGDMMVYAAHLLEALDTDLAVLTGSPRLNYQGKVL